MCDLTKPLPRVVTGLIEKRREFAGRIEGLATHYFIVDRRIVQAGTSGNYSDAAIPEARERLPPFGRAWRI